MAHAARALALALVLTGAAAAAPVQPLRVAAASGDPAAQAALGDAYAQGIGVTKSWPQAFAWYIKAARAGHAAAYLPVASAYHDGRGAPKDLTKALWWFEKAAAAGNAVAANELAYHTAEAGGDLSRAQALADQALAKEPENPHYLDTKAGILMRRGSWTEAADLLRKAHVAEPHDSEIAAHLGDAEHHRKPRPGRE